MWKAPQPVPRPGRRATARRRVGDLAVVRDFCARELVLVGAAVLLGKSDIDAECAMVVWHDDDDPATPPVCVEFSFKYANEDEDYRGSWPGTPTTCC